jgi:hypothetical protein
VTGKRKNEVHFYFFACRQITFVFSLAEANTLLVGKKSYIGLLWVKVLLWREGKKQQ